MKKIMIIDESPLFLDYLTKKLEEHGFEVVAGKNGLDVCRDVRDRYSGAILMLTARGEEIDEVLGLELGADDYVAKPYHMAEVVARVEHVKIKSHYKGSTTLEMVLREGRNREIRRVLAKVGHKVLRLVRVAVGCEAFEDLRDDLAGALVRAEALVAT